MKTFFTSDTHFGHARIIELSKRPFANVDEMNEAIIQRWNAVVGPGDIVYHLGDAFMGPPETVQLRKRLNGRIILVKGNHDKKDVVLLAAGVDEIHRRLEIELEGHKLYLAHIPKHLHDPTGRQYPVDLMQDLPTDYDYFLCGHVHGSWKRQGKTINVGVDVSDFTPLTLEQLLARDTEQEVKHECTGLFNTDVCGKDAPHKHTTLGAGTPENKDKITEWYLCDEHENEYLLLMASDD